MRSQGLTNGDGVCAMLCLSVRSNRAKVYPVSCAMYRKIEGRKIELDQTQCNTTATEQAKQGSEAKPD